MVSITAEDAIGRLTQKISKELTQAHSKLPVPKPELINIQRDMAAINSKPTISPKKASQQPKEEQEIAKNILENHSHKNFIIPKYPNRAKTRGIEGEVRVKFDIDQNSEVIDARIVSIGSPKVFQGQYLRQLRNQHSTQEK